MSNPISVFVGKPAEVIDALRRQRSGDLDGMPFANELGEDASDDWCVDLADLIAAGADTLGEEEADLLSILAGDEADETQDDGLGINLCLSAQAIAERFPGIIAARGQDIAARLFRANESWASEQELAGFLQRWIGAMGKACRQGSGLVWVVWI
jgi:hypothetical protein